MVSNARNIQYRELLWHESAVKKRAKLIEIATNMMFNHAKWETVVRAMLLARCCGWECHGISLETGHAFTRSPPSTIRLDRPKKMATATIRHSTKNFQLGVFVMFSDWVFLWGFDTNTQQKMIFSWVSGLFF